MASDEHEARKIQLVMELRRLGLEADNVLDAMERVPRHLFVPRTFQEHAYDNTALPIACGQTISQPSIVALMTAALALDDRCVVLEVGTGSGYQTAVLAQIARRVYTIERFKELLREAEQRFAALHLSNITTRHGDGSRGWPEAAPFDRILVTAAAPEVPEALLEQLKFGGVLVLPVGESVRNQTLLRIIKTPYGLEQETLSAVRFVPLVEGVA